MKITLCGSIAFMDDMLEAKKELEENGHEVFLPPEKVEIGGEEIPVEEYYRMRKSENPGEDVFELKAQLMKKHYRKIEKSDAILVINQEKNGVAGYIGGNTFLEMGIAHYEGKQIYLVNPMPDMGYTEELKGMKPEIINNLSDLEEENP